MGVTPGIPAAALHADRESCTVAPPRGGVAGVDLGFVGGFAGCLAADAAFTSNFPLTSRDVTVESRAFVPWGRARKLSQGKRLQ
jgi:hypothetical protein